MNQLSKVMIELVVNFPMRHRFAAVVMPSNASHIATVVAGTISSVASMAATYPLDNIMTRKQVRQNDDSKKTLLETIKEIYNKQGLAGLYVGMESSLIGVGITWATFYYVHEWLKRQWRLRRSGDMPSAFTSLLFSLIAGSVSVLTSNPAWVTNARLKVRRLEGSPQGFFSEVSNIYKEEGIKGLMSGVGPSLLLVINPAIQFAIYENLRGRILSRRKNSNALPKSIMKSTRHVQPFAPTLSAMEGFLVGAFSKLVATLLTYPMQVVKTHLQVKPVDCLSPSRGDSDPPRILKERSIQGVIDNIMEISGWQGFFAGIETKLATTMLNSALMFMILERIMKKVSRVVDG